MKDGKMCDTIECPHCNGTGRVPEDFLTDDHVDKVFSDYCDIFNIAICHGVYDWRDCGRNVQIVQDLSSYGCFNTETHYLPRRFFSRNRDTRLARITEVYNESIRTKQAEEMAAKLAELIRLETRSAILRGELERVS